MAFGLAVAVLSVDARGSEPASCADGIDPRTFAADSDHAPDATKDDIAECDEHADGVTAGNAMVGAWAFTPRDMATSVRADGVTGGPFVDTNHIVAGFYIIEATDLEAAVAIARTNPAIGDGGGVEVRPIHSGGMVQAASS